MTVLDRNLSHGQMFHGSYKGRLARMRYEVEPTTQIGRFVVVEPEEFASEHRSITYASRAVSNDKARNGWDFWTPDGQETPETPKTAIQKTSRTRKAKAKAPIAEPVVVVGRAPEPKKVRQIRKARRQDGVPEGKVRMHCSACQRAFFAENAHPAACPEGHAAVVEDDLAWEGDALSAKAQAPLA